MQLLPQNIRDGLLENLGPERTRTCLASSSDKEAFEVAEDYCRAPGGSQDFGQESFPRIDVAPCISNGFREGPAQPANLGNIGHQVHTDSWDPARS